MVHSIPPPPLNDPTWKGNWVHGVGSGAKPFLLELVMLKTKWVASGPKGRWKGFGTEGAGKKEITYLAYVGIKIV